MAQRNKKIDWPIDWLNVEMDNFKKFTHLGMSLRRKLGIPLKWPLHEVQFDLVQSKETWMRKDACDLLAESLNCIFYNPFFLEEKDEKWEYVKDGNYRLAFRIDNKDSYKHLYEARLEQRKEAMRRKKEGIKL